MGEEINEEDSINIEIANVACNKEVDKQTCDELHTKVLTKEITLERYVKELKKLLKDEDSFKLLDEINHG